MIISSIDFSYNFVAEKVSGATQAVTGGEDGKGLVETVKEKASEAYVIYFSVDFH